MIIFGFLLMMLLDREYQQICRRREREERRLRKVIRVKCRRLMNWLLRQIAKNHSKYQERIRKAFSEFRNSVVIWKSKKLVGDMVFSLNEMENRHFLEICRQVISEVCVGGVLQRSLEFQKARLEMVLYPREGLNIPHVEILVCWD